MELVISYIYEALKIKLRSSGLGTKHLTYSRFMGPGPERIFIYFINLFETKFLCVTLPVLELKIPPASARIKSVCHYILFPEIIFFCLFVCFVLFFETGFSVKPLAILELTL